MSSPLEHAKALIEEAARMYDTANHERAKAQMEIHQMRRRLERAQEQYAALDERYAQLEQRLDDAEQQAERSRRAMLDHAART